MRDGDDLQKAFLTPVARGKYGSQFVWRPGANPLKLYRRTTAFAQLCALRACLTIVFLICAGCSVLATFLLGNSFVIAISLYVITASLGSLLASFVAVNYPHAVLKIRGSWLKSVQGSELYLPRSELEISLVDSLATIQHSRTVAMGIVGNERVTDLHKHTWALLTSQRVTQSDVDTLQQTAAEVTKIDQVLAEQASKIGYDDAREAGKALQDHSQAMTEELRLFRKFLGNERDE